MTAQPKTILFYQMNVMKIMKIIIIQYVLLKLLIDFQIKMNRELYYFHILYLSLQVVHYKQMIIIIIFLTQIKNWHIQQIGTSPLQMIKIGPAQKKVIRKNFYIYGKKKKLKKNNLKKKSLKQKFLKKSLKLKFLKKSQKLKFLKQNLPTFLKNLL